MALKTFSFIFGAAAVAAVAGAQVSFTGLALTEDFNSLASATSPFSATVGTQAAIPGLSTWRGAKIAGSGATAMPWVTDDGTSNTGGLRNSGATSASDRALGSLGSGSNTPAFGVEIVNNAANAIDSFVLTFSGEQYRSSTSIANVLTFAYGFSGGTATSSNFLSSASLTNDATGNVLGQAAVASNGIISPAANLGSYTVTISNINVPVGGSIFFRWQDVDNTGSDASLAIDDLRFTATTVPTPGSAALLALGGLLAVRRRR